MYTVQAIENAHILQFVNPIQIGVVRVLNKRIFWAVLYKPKRSEMLRAAAVIEKQ